jgi:hypothetical protein
MSAEPTNAERAALEARERAAIRNETAKLLKQEKEDLLADQAEREKLQNESAEKEKEAAQRESAQQDSLYQQAVAGGLNPMQVQRQSQTDGTH